MTDYVSKFPKRFPSRWEAMIEYRRQQAGLYTPKELNIIRNKVREKRHVREKEENVI